MPLFEEHIAQAKRNLEFLSQSSINVPSYWDWQVTITFYVSVHLVNAHLASKGHFYKTHKEVETIINPFDKNSVVNGLALNEDSYAAYKTLSNLSRISRYLYNPESANNKAEITKCKHILKALKNLSVLMDFMHDNYHIVFEKYSLNIDSLSGGKYFVSTSS